MLSLVDYFHCGKCSVRSNKLACDFIVSNISDLNEKIFPFFDKYTFQGAKALDYEYFKKIAKIMSVKGHLTDSGLEEIIKIREEMNKGRSSN